MTADEVRAALRVLQEGRATHNIYEVEDAAATIAPVKRAYWRTYAAVTLVATIPVSVGLALLRAPTGSSMAIVLLLPSLLLSLRRFRDNFMPVRGLSYDDIVRASVK